MSHLQTADLITLIEHHHHQPPPHLTSPPSVKTINRCCCCCCCCCCCVTSVVLDSVRPHGRQPTKLPRPWDSPGKNTGVGCHFLLQCMIVKSESEVAQLCPTRSNAHQAPPSMGYARQEYWSGMPLPSLIGVATSS